MRDIPMCACQRRCGRGEGGYKGSDDEGDDESDGYGDDGRGSSATVWMMP